MRRFDARHLALGILALLAASAIASAEIRYARNFTIADRPTHRLITVSNPWRGAGATNFAYALVPKGQETPSDLPSDALVIRTPVERLVTFSTIYLGFLEELDLFDRLVGAAHVKLASNPRIRKLARTDRIKALKAGASLDIETILLLQPELILASSTGESQYDAHPKLLRARQPVALTASYMEAHPLARAEWIKFIAAFFDKNRQAAQFFNRVARQYESLAKLADTAPYQPTVFTNAPFAGKWHVPGGDSFTAAAIEDAGARYLWANDATAGGIPLDFERVFHKAADADFWLHQGSIDSRQGLLALDARFSRFDAFQKKNVFNNTRRVTPAGGNDLWERGVTHPEEVLADLIKIFHPTLLPDHELIYYEQLK